MPTTVARIKDGNLLLSNEINERLPCILDGLYRHHPFDNTVSAYIPAKIRYIRDYLNGSNINNGNHWVEIQAFDYSGNNVAFGKSGTSSLSSWDPLVTNNITSTNPYFSVGTNSQWSMLDLADTYELEFIKIWHYYGDGRTYYNTKTEVSEDGINWFTIFDSFIEGTYVETSNGKIHDLKNLGTTVNPSVANGIVFTNNKLAIHETTNNLIINGNFKDGINGWTLISGNIGNATLEPTYLYDQPCLYNDVGYYTDTSHYMYTIQLLANTTYTVSFKVFLISGTIVFDAKGKWNSYVEINSTIGQWQTYQYSFTTDTTNGTQDFNFYGTAARAKYYLTDVQLEVKPFATTYTQVSRNTAGRIDIPFKLLPPYTINLYHTGFRPFTQIINQAASPMIFQMNNYYSNASISFWHYVQSLRVYIKGNTSAGWTGTTTHYTYNTNTWDNKEHMYTLVAVNNRTFRVYVDGVYVGQNISSEDVTNITYLSMGNTSMPNATYRDLSIYNRQLSDAEVKKLYGQSMKIDNNGKMYVDNIIEKIPDIPPAASYFPLLINGQNSYLNIVPALESNTVCTKNSMWLGASTTNLYSQVIPSTPDANILVSIYGTSPEGYTIYKAAKTSTDNLAAWASARLSVGITSGSSYTISFKAKSISGEDIRNRIAIHWGGGNSKYQSVEYLGDGWYEFSGTYSLAASNVNCGVGIVGTSNAFEFLYTEVQMEAGTFATPFVLTTRNWSRLNYTGNTVTSNNWTEFTFMLWVKYKQNSVWRLSGAWNKWYFGANTSNGLTFSWTDPAQKSLVTAGGIIQKDKWYHICVSVKSGVVASIYLDGVQKANRTADINLTSTTTNFAVNGIAHNDSSYPLNSYIKYMILIDSALTDAQIQSLYSVQARSYKDNFYIRGNIIENQLL